MDGSPEPADEPLAEAEAALAAVDRDPVSGLPTAERQPGGAPVRATPWRRPTAERAWGHALLHVGELDNAVRHLSRAAAWGVRAGRADLAAEARYKLAFAVLQRGRPQAALREIDAALPDLTGMAAARARAQRAIVLHVIGRLDESLAEFEVALQVLRRHADLLGVQRMLINRALVHSDRHAFSAAERDLLEAETLARELGRPLTIGLIANNLGLMETLRGDVPAALRHLDRAERIIGAHGAQLGTLHQDRAELLLSVGLTAEAKAAAARAVDAYRRERRSLKVPEVQVLLATGRDPVRRSGRRAGPRPCGAAPFPRPGAAGVGGTGPAVRPVRPARRRPPAAPPGGGHRRHGRDPGRGGMARGGAGRRDRGRPGDRRAPRPAG
ncbi:hypothetical protein [Microbispora sp. GKU 823]|uniref:hypothetical protein n=1 Tax=Microbispora sp. GKU 823 TaxID=1652100 RepID=UPI0009A3CE05|nr:hypothetical protein [Microbispora sp. GKU 823]OPG14324.1 hypothetical protein B1L11_03310 [Microbispora sp. GKU 823]